jgi:hypothetical protein
MSELQTPIADIVQEAKRLIDQANASGFPLRLLGGLAIYLQCPSARNTPRLQRSYGDLDLATLSQWNAKTKNLLTSLGYTGNKTFNTLHGYQRLLFYDEQNGRKVDIFIDRMNMCHTLDFRTRLTIDTYTLPLSDLLLTKLQIVEINEKDLTDIISLFMDHEVAENDAAINSAYIGKLVADDWGLYKTCEINLKKTQECLTAHTFPPQVNERITALLTAMESRPKSLKWKARAAVGERLRWYELPEETR